MFDTRATALLKPTIDTLARWLNGWGLRADQLTVAGFFIGVFAAYSVANSAYFTGLFLIIFSRILDALDGAVARQTSPTDAGGFLDISLDFLFYASIPLAFAWANPPQNALPAAVLLAAFMGTASSFLAFATLAAKRGLHSQAYPHKSLYFLGGLTEATETLVCFVAMCVFPGSFPELAYGFAALCAITITTRIASGYHLLKNAPSLASQPAQPAQTSHSGKP